MSLCTHFLNKPADRASEVWTVCVLYLIQILNPTASIALPKQNTPDELHAMIHQPVSFTHKIVRRDEVLSS